MIDKELWMKLIEKAKEHICNVRKPNDMKYAFDLFYTRLLKIKERMNTKLGKMVAERRTEFLHGFLAELSLELEVK